MESKIAVADSTGETIVVGLIWAICESRNSFADIRDIDIKLQIDVHHLYLRSDTTCYTLLALVPGYPMVVACIFRLETRDYLFYCLRSTDFAFTDLLWLGEKSKYIVKYYIYYVLFLRLTNESSTRLLEHSRRRRSIRFL